MSDFSRRDFLKTASISLFTLSIPEVTFRLFEEKKELKLGLISDLHVDIIHDGSLRLETFLAESLSKTPDCLIQMGDFAIPKPENFSTIQTFNSAHSRAYHVLGNHDMDEGYSREEVAKTFGMPGLYYALDLESIRLIVLDGNDPGSPKYKGGYASYIGIEQQDWLRSELEQADKPVLIVSHQPLAGIYTIDNAEEIQQILSEFSPKILLATCPYSQALFAFLTIDPLEKKITIEGKRAKWLGPSPQQLGYSILNEREQRDNLRPEIKSRQIG